MKKLKYILPIMLVSIFANAGSEGTGGGDPCENRIKEIASDIKSWISKGGAKDLNLPSDMSVPRYASGMVAEIDKAQALCVGEKDKGYPVQVQGVPKVCRFDITKNGNFVTCDKEKLLSLTENEQYELIHHEYAGLAGFEKPNGANSNYEISNQISGYLVDVVVKKLAVKSGPTQARTGSGTIEEYRAKCKATKTEDIYKAYLDYEAGMITDALKEKNVQVLKIKTTNKKVACHAGRYAMPGYMQEILVDTTIGIQMSATFCVGVKSEPVFVIHGDELGRPVSVYCGDKSARSKYTLKNKAYDTDIQTRYNKIFNQNVHGYMTIFQDVPVTE